MEAPALLVTDGGDLLCVEDQPQSRRRGPGRQRVVVEDRRRRPGFSLSMVLSGRRRRPGGRSSSTLPGTGRVRSGWPRWRRRRGCVPAGRGASPAGAGDALPGDGADRATARSPRRGGRIARITALPGVAAGLAAAGLGDGAELLQVNDRLRQRSHQGRPVPGTCRRAQSARRCRTLRSCARCPPRWSTDTAPGRRQLVLGEQILQCRPAPSERPRRGVRARERQQGKAGLFLAGSSRGAVNQALIREFPNGNPAVVMGCHPHLNT